MHAKALEDAEESSKRVTMDHTARELASKHVTVSSLDFVTLTRQKTRPRATATANRSQATSVPPAGPLHPPKPLRPPVFRQPLAPVANHTMPPIPGPSHGPAEVPTAKRTSAKRKRAQGDASEYHPETDSTILCLFVKKDTKQVCGEVLIDDASFITKHCQDHSNAGELPRSITGCPFCKSAEKPCGKKRRKAGKGKEEAEGDNEDSDNMTAVSSFSRHIHQLHLYERYVECEYCKQHLSRGDSLYRHYKTCKALKKRMK